MVGIWRAQLRRIRLKQQLKMEHFEAEKLREVDQLKSRFFANISHEFRTPLTLIKGPVKQILDGEFAGNLKEQCKMILRNSDRLLGLINQILDLSKLESGETKLKVVETDIFQYLKGIILTFSPLADRNNVTLKFKSTEDELTGFVDRDKLEKIVTNLLSNAFKFTPENGEIVFDVNKKQPPLSPFYKGETDSFPLSRGESGGCSTSSQFPIPNSDFVEIKITNTGPGIPPEQLDKIFDRFYQTDDMYKKDGESSGIGLALTKELVELHHGTIDVQCKNLEKHPPQSPLNRGEYFLTTFMVLLPVGKENYTSDEIIKANREHSPLDKGVRGLLKDNTYCSESERITQRYQSKKSNPLLLIVEDNPDVTEYISGFMKNDHRIITAENGKEGLKKALDKYPDLIISDVMMPEMDGFEFCQKVKSDERISHIPVILLTAKADLDSKIEGLEFGADDYIPKPFEADELKVRSKNLIEQRNKLREKFSRMIEIRPGEITASSMDEQFLQRLLDVFENHISDPDYNTELFASEIGMSRSNLYRKIQALTNQSTHDFIQSLRLKRAVQLLQKRSATISEIAYAVGFNSPSYFSKVFRQHFDQSPSDFITHSKSS